MVEKCIKGCGRLAAKWRYGIPPSKHVKGMCLACAMPILNNSKEKKKEKKSSKKRTRHSDRARAITKADRWFSRLRRAECMNKYGYVQDIITLKLYRPERVDNGHFFSRAHFATRYDKDNCWPQNRKDNRFRGEACKEDYERHLIMRIGQERFDILKAKVQGCKFKFSVIELQRMAEKFKLETYRVLKEKNQQPWWKTNT